MVHRSASHCLLRSFWHLPKFCRRNPAHIRHKFRCTKCQLPENALWIPLNLFFIYIVIFEQFTSFQQFLCATAPLDNFVLDQLLQVPFFFLFLLCGVCPPLNLFIIFLTISCLSLSPLFTFTSWYCSISVKFPSSLAAQYLCHPLHSGNSLMFIPKSSALNVASIHRMFWSLASVNSVS